MYMNCPICGSGERLCLGHTILAEVTSYLSNKSNPNLLAGPFDFCHFILVSLVESILFLSYHIFKDIEC